MTYAKKSLGQNFLMHARIAERIALVAGLKDDDTVLEIGPGTGMLTRALLARAQKVIAIEADGELFAGLQETFAQEIREGRLDLRHEDIRAFDPSTIAGDYALVANIPYYITGEIFRMFLSAAHQPHTMTLLVQKEVAVRIARDKKESVLSLSVKAYGTPKYEFTVPRGAFRPAPNVDSAVLSIKNISRQNFAAPGEEGTFFKILHTGFAQKRKKLLPKLANSIDATALGAAIIQAHLKPDVRAEELSLEQWLALAAAARSE